MARRRRRDNPTDEIGGLLILLALWVWYKVGNTTFYIIIGSVFIFSVGIIVFLIRKRKQKLLDSGISIIDSMTGEKFEELVLEHFRKLCYKGRMTPATADYGADLILENDNEKIVAQVKRWKRNVGIEAIQQAVASIKHYKADRGMVITNSYFTPNAEELAKSNNIELWNTNACPTCGNELKIRNGKHGKFYGCGSFPKCRFTRDL